MEVEAEVELEAEAEVEMDVNLKVSEVEEVDSGKRGGELEGEQGRGGVGSGDGCERGGDSDGCEVNLAERM